MALPTNVIPMEQEPQPIPSKATLYAKLAKVMGKVNRIEKTGENAHFKYNYVTDADVADAVRSALAEEKVAFLADMIEDTRDGNKTTVWFEFTFACGDTGATITKRWKGESIDQQDKGISKAATSAEKYFLMKTFLMSSGQPEEDADSGPAPDAGKPQRRVDTSEPAPEAPKSNGRVEPLFQYMMKNVTHPRYPKSEAKAATINKLMAADLLTDNGNREELVKIVHGYADMRDNGLTENEAMTAIRQRINAAPPTAQEG